VYMYVWVEGWGGVGEPQNGLWGWSLPNRESSEFSFQCCVIGRDELVVVLNDRKSWIGLVSDGDVAIDCNDGLLVMMICHFWKVWWCRALMARK
jgi:hypothetical protein